MNPQLLVDAEFAQPSQIGSGSDWNWVRQPELNYNEVADPSNYYESTLAPWVNFSSLASNKVCEVVVIGGGLLGSSTALHLSEASVDTILLEKKVIGSGASGRNGGQLTPGLARWEAESMVDNLSQDEARRLWHFTSTEAMSLIDNITDRYSLDVERQYGHITAAVHPGHMNALVRSADLRRFLGDESVKILGNYELKEHINSEIYYGGVLDDTGGQVHSLALNRGLIFGFVSNGGKVHEQSEVTKIEEVGGVTLVHTPGGTITATKGVVIAVHDATHTLLNEKSATTFPFYSYVGVTRPITGGSELLLPTGKPVYDTQLQIDYYRPVRNDRLLFGGQGTGFRWGDKRTIDYLTSRLRHVFPQHDDLMLDFAWSGTTDLTLNGATDSRRTGRNSNIYSVHGWSGHGIAQTVRIGKAICDDIKGDCRDFSMLSAIKHTPLMIGRKLSPVALTLAKTLLGLTSRLVPGKIISF